MGSNSSVFTRHSTPQQSLSCFLYRELKNNILASELLVYTFESLHLPFCAVPVLGVQIHLHIKACSPFKTQQADCIVHETLVLSSSCTAHVNQAYTYTKLRQRQIGCAMLFIHRSVTRAVKYINCSVAYLECSGAVKLVSYPLAYNLCGVH